jgi:hypothetical protein
VTSGDSARFSLVNSKYLETQLGSNKRILTMEGRVAQDDVISIVWCPLTAEISLSFIFTEQFDQHMTASATVIVAAQMFE